MSLIEQGEVFARAVLRALSRRPEARWYDVVCTHHHEIEIDIEEGVIKKAEDIEAIRTGVRVIGPRGNVGFVSTTKSDLNWVDRVCDLSCSLMGRATPDPDFRDLAHPAPSDGLAVPFDDTTARSQLDDLVPLLNRILALKQVDHYKALSAGIDVAASASITFNSNGIELQQRGTSCSVGASLTLEADEIGSGYYGQTCCRLEDLDPEFVATRAHETAHRQLVKRALPTKQYPVVLSPGAVASLIVGSIVGGINAEEVQNDRSFLGSHVGTLIGGSALTIWNDPTVAWRPGTTPYDGEGVPTHKTALVDRGVLTTLTHNTYTAAKAGTVSNGFGVRSSGSQVTGISPQNIVMAPGETPVAEIIGSIEEGIYFDSTGDRPNMVTGDFSGLIMTGNYISGGEMVSGLREALVGIHLLDLYDRIEDVSRETEWRGRTCVPTIKISHATVSGSQE
jgi:PmbA protein